jgi:prefoldin subunit 5
MATTTSDTMAERNLTEEVFRLKVAEEVFRLQKADRESNKGHGENGVEMEAERHHVEAGRSSNGRRSETEELRPADGGESMDGIQELVLAPLVDRVAYGLAKVLVFAVRELENHIAGETRKVGDTVGRRLDTLQGSFQDLTEALSEQRSKSLAVEEKCQQLAAATASLQGSDARQDAGLAALRSETRAFSTMVSERIDGLFKELGVQQEDIAAIKSTLGDFSSRVDAFVERLDKQADVLRSMCSTYSQRETELEQLVDGLARLRAYPAPAPTTGL